MWSSLDEKPCRELWCLVDEQKIPKVLKRVAHAKVHQLGEPEAREIVKELLVRWMDAMWQVDVIGFNGGGGGGGGGGSSRRSSMRSSRGSGGGDGGGSSGSLSRLGYLSLFAGDDYWPETFWGLKPAWSIVDSDEHREHYGYGIGDRNCPYRIVWRGEDNGGWVVEACEMIRKGTVVTWYEGRTHVPNRVIRNDVEKVLGLDSHQVRNTSGWVAAIQMAPPCKK